MKRTSKLLGTLLLGAALVSPSFGAQAAEKAQDGEKGQEKFRVYIQSEKGNFKKEAKKKYGSRWDLDEETFSTSVNQSQYEALQKNKNLSVQKVSQVQVILPGGSNKAVSPSDQTPWGIEAIYEDPAIQVTSGGDNVRVAVLDTGVKTNHQDLENRAEQCKDFTGLLFPLKNGSCSDLHGHGTHVAGSVLADGGDNGTGIYGVAPDAKLWAYKVLGDSGMGFSDDIAAAIRHASDESKRLGVNLVISMSLGSDGKDELISEAVEYAYTNGTLVVAAAGNSGPDENTIGYPGGLKDAVAVAALENTFENGTYRIADFSSRGNPATDGDYVIGEQDVEVSAPGRNILSTWNDGNYNTISGTSMATPYVSGLAAKIWAENPALSNSDLRSELQNRAKANDILGGLHASQGDDIASGFGFPTVK
ncbi:S8 family peptidase [Bacillus sp. SG-1]|uniref:S8 family peptidase n=1 Tax=Bacillus sp. SG-1 TaxID=161544 RepID=UPI0002D7ABFB|nr:S8 family peptidase [Bacillus sp. SG-1]